MDLVEVGALVGVEVEVVDLLMAEGAEQVGEGPEAPGHQLSLRIQ